MYFVTARKRHIKSSRSLSHLLMSFLYDAVIAARIDGVIARGNDTVNAAVIAARNAS